MRLPLLVLALAACPVAAVAAPDLSGADPNWIKDPISGCWAADPAPEPGESIAWSGACVEDLVSGEGTLTWYKDGHITGTDEGTFKAGELSGHARVTRADGSSYDGDFPGNGTITLPDGTHVPGLSIKERAGWSIEQARPPA